MYSLIRSAWGIARNFSSQPDSLWFCAAPDDGAVRLTEIIIAIVRANARSVIRDRIGSPSVICVRMVGSSPKWSNAPQPINMGLRRALQLSYTPIGDDNRRTSKAISLYHDRQSNGRAMKSERV